MPRILKWAELQVRQFPFAESGLGVLAQTRHALLLPYRAVKRYQRSLAANKIVVSGAFDVEHNIETSERVHETDLDVRGPNWIHSSPYFPTPSRLLVEALAGIDIRFEDFTFIDLGSGKGRVLFMASEFPFRKIIGVEFSPALTAIAHRNIATYRGPQKCREIELVCMDFTEFEFPEVPLFVFLYNPASLHLTKLVGSKLMSSIAKCPRPAWILYVTPYGEVFDSEKTLHKVREGECLTHPWCLYRSLRT